MVWGEVLGGLMLIFFFFNDTATTEIYTLSLHDALPIYKPDMSDAIDGCIGELSPFHHHFGYYAHGVGKEKIGRAHV